MEAVVERCNIVPGGVGLYGLGVEHRNVRVHADLQASLGVELGNVLAQRLGGNNRGVGDRLHQGQRTLLSHPFSQDDRVGAGGSRLAEGILWQGPDINPGPKAQFFRALGFALPRDGRSVRGRDGLGEGHRGTHRGQAFVRALVDVLHLHELSGILLLVPLKSALSLKT